MSGETFPISPEEERTLRHMLGIDKPHVREPEAYRNRYAANPGDPKLARLAALGLVKLVAAAGVGGVFDAYDCYRCTPAGEAAARASHRRTRLSKSKRVYARYLSVSDCCSGLTFRTFLTHPDFAEIRRSA